MAQSIVPYSPGYVQNYQGSQIGSELGYGPQAAPYAPGSAASNSQPASSPYSSAPNPYHDTGGVLGDSTTSSGATSASASDPNADKLAAYNTQNQGVLQAANASTGSAARSYGSSIQDYLGQAQQQQNNINNQGVQSELSRRQAAQGILDYVHNGLQSGGVMLANRNAGNSSATEALARAYATLGQHQMAGVGTQYAQNQGNINTQQTNLDLANQTQGRHNQEFKANTVESIVQTAQQAINGIQANMQYASLPQQINFQQEIDQIRAQAQSQLNGIDPQFSAGIANITPSSLTQRQSGAATLANAGTAATNPYALTSQAPATFQGQNPAGADLPIFTIPRSKQTA